MKKLKNTKFEFWSSVEYSGFGNALVSCIVAKGAQASLKYEVRQVEYWRISALGRRLAFRLRSYCLYPMRLVWRFVRHRDKVLAVVSTNTFYAPYLANIFKNQNVRVIHWVLDLYPDVLVLHGIIKSNGWLDKLTSHLIEYTMRRSAANVFLGRHLLAYAESRFGPIRNAFIIPVGADGGPFRGCRPSLRPGPLRILYAGNLGRMHDVETIAGALAVGLPAGISLVFRASGAGYRELRGSLEKVYRENFCQDGRGGVHFGGSLGEAGWREEMLSADIALVTLRLGAEGLIMPSKTYSAMVAGQAILAIAPRNSDLGELVQKYDCGWLVEPGDVGCFIDTLNQIVASRDLVLRKRMASFRAGHSYFDQGVLADEWIRLGNKVRELGAGS